MRTRSCLRTLAVLAAATSLGQALPAATPQEGGFGSGAFAPALDKLSVTSVRAPARAAPGEAFEVVVGVEVVDGWHVYGAKQDPEFGQAATIRFDEGSGLERISSSLPDGTRHEAYGIETWWVSGAFEMTARVRLPAGTAAGTRSFAGAVDYMACDETTCDEPKSAPFSFELEVAAPAAGAGGSAGAQDPASKGPVAADPANHIRVDRVWIDGTPAPGEEVTLRVEVTIDQGWHTYGALESMSPPIALEVTPPAGSGVDTAGGAQVPGGLPHVVEGLGDTAYWLDGTFELSQTLRISADAAAGERALDVRLDYMVCDETSCLAPSSLDVPATLRIAGPDGGAAAAADRAAPRDGPVAADPKNHIRVDAVTVDGTPAPGNRVTVRLQVTLDPGWHTYGAAETLSPPIDLDLGAKPPIQSVGGAVVPPGMPHEAFGETSFWVDGTFEIRHAARIDADAEPGPVDLTASLSYMVCNETSCLDPATLPVPVRIDVVPGAVATAPVAAERGPAAGAAGGSTPPRTGDDVSGSSLWELLLLAIGAGLFALVMPCTYPMIPVTFSFFTKQADARGGNVLSLALIYGLGVVTMFALIGFLLGPVIIEFANHWITNLVIGVVFVFFALVLFGAVDLQPPSFLMNAAGRASRSGGLLGVFAMGATLVIATFTCTGPFIGSVLAASGSGSSASLAKVVFTMAVFGLTMAIPFVVLALVPGRLKAMPRSGEWMHVVKVTMGFVELAAALKFFSTADIYWAGVAERPLYLPRDLFLWLWTGIFLTAGMFLFNIIKLEGESSERIGAGRLATGVAFVLFAIYCGHGASGAQLDRIVSGFVPAESSVRIGAAGPGSPGTAGTDGERHEKSKAPWPIFMDDLAAARALAAEQDKLVLFNYTGFG